MKNNYQPEINTGELCIVTFWGAIILLVLITLSNL